MRKSNLKYVLFAVVILTIFGLYKWNQKFFDPESYNKKSVGTTVSSGEYSSGSSISSSSEWSDSNSGASSGETNSSSFSSSSGFTGSSSNISQESYTYGSSETTDNGNALDYSSEEQISYTSGGNSGGGGSSNLAMGVGVPIGMGIPISSENDRKSEEEEKRVENNSSSQSVQVSKSKFFDQLAGKGGGETPMAPLPPDEDVPLDGGASLIMLIGSAFGLRKLFGKKVDSSTKE